ncbi:EAL domain-containing protein [Rhodoferax sp.]|uniref:bifunctional diguanylate cyclase/phosphodiesterase n=1 Tax=Rhodoferax sp. TaxID=50421 RepID=UPI002633DE8A|nr:EAL domain-containing protein [Rhodoferax sp.]MDD2926283.1 EAL domain-containing protein [Rhodoferax sp.]
MVKLGLKWRLALSIGALALFSALLVSQIASHLSRSQIERDQSALLQNIAVRMSSQLAHDMSTRANEILFLAGHDRIKDATFPAERKRLIFERTRLAYPYYAWIGMTDANGTIVAASDNLLLGKSVAEREWFIKGRDGLHFGDAHDAFLLAKLLPKPKWDDLPLRLVDLSAPVYDNDGKFLGVICGHLSLDWAFEVRETMLDQLSRDQLDVIVLNKHGKVLMGTPQLPSLKVELASLKTYQGLAQHQRQVAVETWPDQQRYLTATVREVPFRNYPGMGWAVVARKAEVSAFGPAQDLSRLILLSGLATAVLFSAILWFVLNRHLRPLEALSVAAEKIRNEDLSAEIPQPIGNGELALFARSLTSLVSSLQHNNAELRLSARVFNESGQGILIADQHNRIVRVNRAFSRITGYLAEDVLGKTPAVLNSGRHGADFYQSMWKDITRHGSWQGEVWNRTQDGHIYPEWLTINTLRDERGVITHFIGIFDDITEKKDYERRLVHLANYDQLTDLPNRNLMQQDVELLLAQARQDNQGMALMFVDLDKFKHINDTLGHPAGDMVLKEVANRFKAQIEPANILARWGGDEFVVAIPGADGIKAANVAKQLIESLQRPFSIEGSRYHISMSAGIAIYPADGRNVDSLLRCADTAMYKAKQDGTNVYRFYESTMNAGVEHFLKIDNALRHALDNQGQHLSLVFQPQYSVDGKRILSAEVLIRWHHPELGQVSPAQFIPIAEDTGQIFLLGNWIIDATVRSYEVLVRSGHELPLSINISALQLRDPRLVKTLHDACTRFAVPANKLMVEVTESAIMSDEIKVMETLTALKAHGYRISIDDFGTGYSCLNYIQKIRPAEIKIDQSFVDKMLTDRDSHSIVEFTLGLATSMGMEVVAEGVETEAQRQELQRLGNIKLQGYLLSRPVPLEQLVPLLQS